MTRKDVLMFAYHEHLAKLEHAIAFGLPYDDIMKVLQDITEQVAELEEEI